MKNKFLLSAMFLLFVIGLFVPVSYSQSASYTGFPVADKALEPTYTMSLQNDVTISPTEYQCDIYITRTGTNPFELAIMQIGLTYNNPIKGTGTMTVSWLGGSQNAALTAAGQMPTLVLATSVPGYIKMAGHLPGGGPGTGTQITTTAMKIGTLRLVNTVPFLGSPTLFSLAWSFGGSYATKIAAYDPNDFTGYDITWPQTSFNTLDGPLPVELSSFASAAQGRSVVLNWSTKTEKNSNRFDIERSLISNTTWSTVGSVKAAVLSNSPKNYSFTDTKLQSGKYQYRIRT
jgi:hypothetical protein